MKDSTEAELSEASEVGWCSVISAVTYWGFETGKSWPTDSVAPAVMQFLAVAGEVTEAVPLLLALTEPSLPAAKTGMKSCRVLPLKASLGTETLPSILLEELTIYI